MLSLRRWRPVHLFLSWLAYWATLAVVTMGPGLLAAWRATRRPGSGTISASVDAGVATFNVIRDGVTTWTGSAGVASIVLWFVGPPVLLWAAWLVSRPRRAAAPDDRRVKM
jgi:hypothetical protein